VPQNKTHKPVAKPTVTVVIDDLPVHWELSLRLLRRRFLSRPIGEVLHHFVRWLGDCGNDRHQHDHHETHEDIEKQSATLSIILRQRTITFVNPAFPAES
jgi:hypothetical protein